MNMIIGGIKVISKESFVSLMKAIVKQNDFEDAINKVFQDYDTDSTLMCYGLESAVVSYLQHEFDDLEEDWLGCFCYECDYLRKFEVGDIVLTDGSMPDIKTWEDAYDFLIGCMNERK